MTPQQIDNWKNEIIDYNKYVSKLIDELHLKVPNFEQIKRYWHGGGMQQQYNPDIVKSVEEFTESKSTVVCK